MFFAKDTSTNFLSTTVLTSNDPKPVAYKGNWSKDQIHGDGFMKFSDGLMIYGQFHHNQLRDTVF
jgi:hypothetical protein